MSRKRALKAAKNNSVFELSQSLINNGKAWEEGPKRKTWSRHDLKNITPLTEAQKSMFEAYYSNLNICGYGSAGTGKTLVGIYLALTEVFNPNSEIDHIIIVRSTVPTRDVGHLPGTLEEKIAPHEEAYHDILHFLIGRPSTYKDMKAAGVIEFKSTSFIRGTTWDNAIVIVDEIQNQNIQEIHSVMTRIGENSKVIALGDIKQNDLFTSRKEVSGMKDFLKVAEMMPEFAMIQFLPDDIVRGPFVRSWITASEKVL